MVINQVNSLIKYEFTRIHYLADRPTGIYRLMILSFRDN